MLVEAQTLLILTLLETILNIDNLIFISLALDKISNTLKKRVRLAGLGLALLIRLLTLFFTSYMLSMQKPIFHAASLNFSIKDLLMIAGGLFLIIKSIIELWNNIFLCKQSEKKTDIKSQPFLVILQITLIDLIFSIDSLLTAIVLTYNITIIVIACAFSILAMIFLSSHTAKLIESSASLKTIAILFILLVGVYLIFEGLNTELPKGYLYSSLTFALLIEVINSIKRKVHCIKKKNSSRFIPTQ
ncbi:TerC family protein [Wolbachia endosymbiont of Dirofilaria (Dirofilaria) immitis]|uniref:TerC family protein n=1 Tax=Wolbachia endosymbiont of Dirofilaria (Dirofilaria) immitis TaxID=1812115 RepID=UPI00158B7F1C|nr:TerC family protein [Wolbachia endosymbiont of Dirofilaria (Dirofilaria) immitis]QKX02001.1 TerC family protein [Wolbachia endosymbiont of Dirofilaria (Dirofilaria) immitis]